MSRPSKHIYRLVLHLQVELVPITWVSLLISISCILLYSLSKNNGLFNNNANESVKRQQKASDIVCDSVTKYMYVIM